MHSPVHTQSIYIVDDDKLARESLAWLFKTIDFKVQAFDSGEAFLAACHPQMRGCVLLDVRMPVINGLEVHLKLKEMGCRLPIIIMTGHADVTMAVRAMKSGAYDFIEKPYQETLILARVEDALAYERDTHQESERIRAIQEKAERLTQREKEVLSFVLASTANKIIADKLGISIKTVELHRANLMQKMQASSATELVRLATIGGIVEAH